MAIASRHSGYPYQNGETLSGTDLETDISNIFTQVNGNLDNSNIASSAAISGTKLATASVTGSQLAAATVTLSNLADAAVSKYALTSKTSTDSMLVGGNVWTTIEGLTAISVTPGAIGDLIVLALTVSAGSTGAMLLTSLRFDVNGTSTGSRSVGGTLWGGWWRNCCYPWCITAGC